MESVGRIIKIKLSQNTYVGSMEMVRVRDPDRSKFTRRQSVLLYLLWFVTECAQFRRMWICLNLADIIIADETLDLAKSVIIIYYLPLLFGWRKVVS